jgi:aspartyl aminopeptidase
VRFGIVAGRRLKLVGFSAGAFESTQACRILHAQIIFGVGGHGARMPPELLVGTRRQSPRYATNAASAFILNEIAKRNQIEVQDFCVRNDAMCGSTVGPILSSNCGVRCVDVGVPQFSMHSIRETCGTKDVDTSTKLLTAFFEQFAQLDACVQQE